LPAPKGNPIDQYEKYLFDLNGYLIVENVLTADQIAACNEAVDQNSHRSTEEHGAHGAEALAGTGNKRQLNGMLTWPAPWSAPFRQMMDQPKIVPYLTELLGPKFLLDHLYGIVMEQDAEGLVLHGGTGLNDDDDFGMTQFFYRFQAGKMRTGLTVVTYLLTDQGPDDGGFMCVPGSHKANFPTPKDVETLEKDIGIVRHLEAKAGSAIIFTEALTHGTLPWRASPQRRAILYKYTPGTMYLAQEYLAKGVEDVLDEFTDAQKAMMNPTPSRPT